MSSDTLEFVLPEPVPQNCVDELIKEHYAFAMTLNKIRL